MQGAGCCEVDKDGSVRGTTAGRICSFYYLQHRTMDLLFNHMHTGMDFKRLLTVLASCPEYDELPVWRLTTECLIPLHREMSSSRWAVTLTIEWHHMNTVGPARTFVMTV